MAGNAEQQFSFPALLLKDVKNKSSDKPKGNASVKKGY